MTRSGKTKVKKLRDRGMAPAEEFFGMMTRDEFVKCRDSEFRAIDLYEPAAYFLADLLGLDLMNAKSLILGRRLWRTPKSLGGCPLCGPPSYVEMKAMCRLSRALRTERRNK